MKDVNLVFVLKNLHGQKEILDLLDLHTFHGVEIDGQRSPLIWRKEIYVD